VPGSEPTEQNREKNPKINPNKQKSVKRNHRMDIQKNIGPGYARLTVSGRIDAFWAPHLQETIDQVLRDGHRTIELDLSDAGYISSAGLRVLVKTTKNLSSAGGEFSLVNPSEAVLTVIRLTGLDSVIRTRSLSSREPKLVHSATADPVFHRNPVGRLSLSARGTFSYGHGSGAEVGKPFELATGPSRYAIGVGALGESDAACRDLYGEFISVAGHCVYLPTDGHAVPDFMQRSETYQPVIHSLNALNCNGEFSIGYGFGNDPENPSRFPLSDLAQDALRRLGTGTVGILAIAEIAGLVGTYLKQSPANLKPGESMFDFPGIRKWLAFSPEKQHRGELAILFGIASDEPAESLRSALRPLASGTDSPLHGRFHSAIFPFRVLRHGELDLQPTLDLLFSEGKPLGVLHLLRDSRPGIGIGESEFVRGCCWAAPIDHPFGENAP
jgi:anti-sigma B factor antagonist